jgi:hypothetical protein
MAFEEHLGEGETFGAECSIEVELLTSDNLGLHLWLVNPPHWEVNSVPVYIAAGKDLSETPQEFRFARWRYPVNPYAWLFSWLFKEKPPYRSQNFSMTSTVDSLYALKGGYSYPITFTVSLQSLSFVLIYRSYFFDRLSILIVLFEFLELLDHNNPVLWA